MLRWWIAAIGIPATLILAPLGAEEHTIVTTIRQVTSSPDRYSDRPVRIIGRFGGRVAPPDMPRLQPLNRTRWDFLLKWDDAAVWVSGFRPAGRDFDLDPLSPADSIAGRWLDVTGTVRIRRTAKAATCAAAASCAQIWIEATDMHLAAPPFDIVLQTALQPRVPGPRIVFHDPIADETGVARATAVRLQFSRAMAAETFSERVRVSYGPHRTLNAPPIPPFTAVYHDDTRGLELRFERPLAPAHTVVVELLEGVRAADGRQLDPWTLTFTTGGN